jgi:hypothetical protein
MPTLEDFTTLDNCAPVAITVDVDAVYVACSGAMGSLWRLAAPAK